MGITSKIPHLAAFAVNAAVAKLKSLPHACSATEWAEAIVAKRLKLKRMGDEATADATKVHKPDREAGRRQGAYPRLPKAYLAVLEDIKSEQDTHASGERLATLIRKCEQHFAKATDDPTYDLPALLERYR